MNDLWSKSTGESLLQHIKSTIVVLNKLCDSLSMSPGEKSSLLSVMKRIGAIHDIGKAASGFQNALKKNKSWGHRHEILSTAVANAIFHDLSYEALMAIITHHRNVPESVATENERCLPLNELPFEDTNPVWDSMVNEWLEQWDDTKDLLSIINELYDLKIADIPNQFTFKGLGLPETILHRTFQKKVNGFKRQYASLLRGILMTADHLASAHQFDLPQIPLQKDYTSVIHHKELKVKPIYPFQRRTAETTGDSILKAPTGSGKTLAILLWAAANQSENGRLFYVLPHTASINAMHGRLRDIYGEKNVGVLHHKSAAYLLRLFENDHPVLDAAKMAKTVSDLARELYHPIRVTTPHQILRIALQGKGWELGLAEFPNACFVFDEIHAFEPLLVGLTIATIKWLKRMGAKVLFASATLPLFLENILKQEIGIPEENIVTPDLSNADDRSVLNKIRHKIDIRPCKFRSTSNTNSEKDRTPIPVISEHLFRFCSNTFHVLPECLLGQY